MNKKNFSTLVSKIVTELNFMIKVDQNSRFSRKTTPTEFEKLVVEASKVVIANEGLICDIDYTEGGHAFPDIVYLFENGAKYGIEVKSSTSSNSSTSSWTILGNSILGSTRIDVEDLHIIFIKVNINGTFINHGRYEDSVSDVAVTHSPRYKLNLSQNPEDSFFAKSGISYNEIKSSDDPIGLVTNYFKSQGETAWWISESTPAIIKTWNELNQNERNKILAKSFLLFPELIYSNASSKYKRLAKWLVANYSVVDSSLRDRFSAGGKVSMTIEKQNFDSLPRIYESFYNILGEFSTQVKEMTIEELLKYWTNYEASNDSFENRLNYWLDIMISKLKIKNEIEFIELLISKINRP